VTLKVCYERGPDIVPKKVGKSFTQHESDFTMQLVKDMIIDKNFD